MIVLKMEVIKPRWLDRGIFNQYRKAAMFEVARFWRSFILKKHFTEAGAAEYRYDTRTIQYQKRKRARFGHNLPLVWTGKTRARLLGPGGVRISATSRRATLFLSGGVGPVNYRKLYKELKTVSQRDLKALAQRWVRYLTRRIARARKLGAALVSHRRAA